MATLHAIAWTIYGIRGLDQYLAGRHVNKAVSSWFMTRCESFTFSQGKGVKQSVSLLLYFSTPCATSCSKQPPKATFDCLNIGRHRAPNPKVGEVLKSVKRLQSQRLIWRKHIKNCNFWGTLIPRHTHTHWWYPTLVSSWRLASAESWTTGCWSTCLKWVCRVLSDS